MDPSYPEFEYYPAPEAIDDMIEGLWNDVSAISCEAEVLEAQGFDHAISMSHMRGYHYVRFTPDGGTPFYGYWQPAPSQPAPLLIHTPGYGARVQVHPDLVARGYNVLHVNPLGYTTPEGMNEDKRQGDTWPVFSDHMFRGFEHGYRPWLMDVMMAVRWAREQPAVLPNRLGFFGTSQGGGASLLLGSIYRDRGVRCVAADEPWLIHFPAYKQLRPEWADDILEAAEEALGPELLWARVGKIDALAHAYRLTFPVLLTAGGADATCPPDTIEVLYQHLPHTKSLTYLQDEPHRYTQPFPTLAAAWFRLYV